MSDRPREVNLADLLQLLCAEKARVLLTVRRAEHAGQCYFDHGELVHAATPTHVGKAALFEMLGWPAAKFELLRGSLAPVRTLSQSCAALLVECAHLADVPRMPRGPTGWLSEERAVDEPAPRESAAQPDSLGAPGGDAEQTAARAVHQPANAARTAPFPIVARLRPAERLAAVVKASLGPRAPKALALLEKAGDHELALRDACAEIVRFTRLFVGDKEADALRERLSSAFD